jgi:SAM-dependent methyltransferase
VPAEPLEGHVPDAKFLYSLSWEEKARINPLWAVMSVSEFESLGGDPAAWTTEQVDAFFAKGEAMWSIFLRPTITRLGLVPGQATIAEYGSGMGRILRAVRRGGYDCAGVDISPTMLEHSRRLVPEVPRVAVLDAAGRSELPEGLADFVYSYAVVQHIQRLSDVRRAVREMARLLKPGGFLRLQFQPLDLPFRAPLLQRQWGINFEHRSITARWLPLARAGVPGALGRVRLPVVLARSHTHWTGVPLAWRTLERCLADGGIDLWGLERDPGANWHSVWALGRKRER